MAMAELLQQQPLSPPSTIGPYRVADYLAMPDEPRCELLYGRLYMSPAPKVVHQIVSSVLFRALDSTAARQAASFCSLPSTCSSPNTRSCSRTCASCRTSAVTS